jgi:uncharacterized membrane protein
MSEATPGTPARRSTALIVSICLNVALVAMIVAGIAGAFFHRGSHWEGGPLGMHAMMSVATPGEREKIEAIIERHQARLDQLGDQARAARRTAYEIFAEPQFDRARYVEALDKMRAADDALKSEVGAMMAEAATQLSPDERQRLASKAERRSRWREGHFRHHFW